MRTDNPRSLVFPWLLMLTLGLLIACGTAAAPTAVPTVPPDSGPSETVAMDDSVEQDGDAMTDDSMEQDGDAMMDDSMEQDGDAMTDDSMEQDGDAMTDDSMEQDGDTMMDAASVEKKLVSGWYRDRAVEYYDFGANSAVNGSLVETAPIYVFIHGFNDDGSPQFVEGQHNIVDLVPGEEGYSDLWQVMLVTVPQEYDPDSITSKAQLDAAGYQITPTDMLVNCPVVPAGTVLEGGEDLVQGWHDGQKVFYPDFGQNIPAAIPIWVFITGLDEEGNPQFVDGQSNIIDAVPGDPGYSAFWRVNLVTVPEDYQPNSVRSAAEVQASGFTVTLTDMVVNCPVTS